MTHKKLKSYCAYTSGGGFWGMIYGKDRKDALKNAREEGCVDVRYCP